MKKIFVVWLWLLLLMGETVHAQMPSERLKYLWKVQWITAADTRRARPSVLYFRKAVDLPVSLGLTTWAEQPEPTRSDSSDFCSGAAHTTACVL